jgi:AcrR family transcriptional regulator
MAAVREAAQAPRRYRGITAEERRAQRRERFLDAGLELFGTLGYANTSIRAICLAASMNQRYFYESFSTREDLLFHVYQRIVGEILADAVKATARVETIEDQARAGLRAGWTILTEDRRKARVVALEIVGVSERLERLRRDTRHALADLTAQNALTLAGADVQPYLDPVLTARSLIGAVVEVLVDWINGDLEVSTDEIVEHFTRMFTAVSYAAVQPPVSSPAAVTRSSARRA